MTGLLAGGVAATSMVLIAGASGPTSVDSTFGNDGVLALDDLGPLVLFDDINVSWDRPQAMAATKIAVGPGGRIVVAGTVNPDGASWIGEIQSSDELGIGVGLVAADGEPVGSFGDGGVRVIERPGTRHVVDTIIDGDGRPVVLVSALGGADGTAQVWRFDVDGDFDEDFGGGDGIVELGPDGDVASAVDEPTALALAGDGSTLVLGETTGANSVVVKLTEAGAPFGSFGTAGVATVAAAGSHGFTAFDVSPSDQIVLATGNYLPDSLNPTTVVFARLTADGVPDATFGTGGQIQVTTTYRSAVHHVEVAPTGVITVGGDRIGRYGWLGRIDAAGTASSFVRTDLYTFHNSEQFGTYRRLADMVMTADGTLFAAVEVSFQSDRPYDAGRYPEAVLHRFTPSGQLDTTFGVHGSMVHCPRVEPTEEVASRTVIANRFDRVGEIAVTANEDLIVGWHSAGANHGTARLSRVHTSWTAATEPCDQTPPTAAELLPKVGCVIDTGSTYRVSFVWANGTGTAITIPHGPDNKIEGDIDGPTPQMPTQFPIGTGVVFVQMDRGGTVSWTLNGRTAIATAVSPACEE